MCLVFYAVLSNSLSADSIDVLLKNIEFPIPDTKLDIN